MKTKTKSAVAENAAEIKVGDPIRFKAYSELLDDPYLQEGQIAYITSVTKDGKGHLLYDVTLEKGSKAGKDSLYPDEFEVLSEEEKSMLEIAADGMQDKKPVAKKSAKKPVVQEEDEEEEEIEEEEIEEDEEESEDEEEDADSDEEEEQDEEIEEEDEEEEIKAQAKALVASKKSAKAPAAKSKTTKQKSAAKKETKKAVKEVKEKVAPKEKGLIKSKEKDDYIMSFLKKFKQAPIAAAKELRKESDEKRFYLGGVLDYIWNNDVFEEEKNEDGSPVYSGFEGFGEFCENVIGISYRQAVNYQNVYRIFRSHGYGIEEVKRIGMTNAGILCPFLKDAEGEVDIDELLEYGSSHTNKEFRSYIQSKYEEAEIEGHGNRNKAKLVKFIFALFDDQAELINQAIQLAKEQAPIEKENATEGEIMSAALLHICETYMDAQ